MKLEKGIVMHKKNHTQQSSSVTHALRNKKPQHFKSTRSTFRDQAIQRGIEEHAHFEKEVAYFYSANSRPESFFIRVFPILSLLLTLAILILLFLLL